MARRLTQDALYRTERLCAKREDVLFLILDGITSVIASDARAIFGHMFGAHSLMYDDANLALLMENLTGNGWTGDPSKARKAFIKAQGGNRLQVVAYTRKGFVPVGWADHSELYNSPEQQVDYSGVFGKAPSTA